MKCICTYVRRSGDSSFDTPSPSYSSLQGYLLEKVRVAQRPAGEAVFNIFHNLLVGADAKLQSDLQLDIPVGDSTNAYINLDQHRDVRTDKEWGRGGEK